MFDLDNTLIDFVKIKRGSCKAAVKLNPPTPALIEFLLLFLIREKRI
jgi:hypothetical protein